MYSYETSGKCCELILKQYPQLAELIQNCPPSVDPFTQNQLLQSLLFLFSWSTCETYQRLRCGRVFCCEGIVNSLFKSIQQYLSHPENSWMDLTGVINCILVQASLSPLNCDLILQTTFTGGTFPSGGETGGDLFDLRAKTDILVERFDIHLSADNLPGNTIEVWIVTSGGTWQGKEDNQSAWTRIAQYPNVTSSGSMTPTTLPPLPYPVPISAGQVQGFYVTGTIVDLTTHQQIVDTNTGDSPGTVVSSDNHLEILSGQFETYPIGPGETPQSTIWNGQVYYCAKTPQTDVMVPVN